MLLLISSNFKLTYKSELLRRINFITPMNNLFFQTTLAPYRIDFYNALHFQLDMEMHCYSKKNTLPDKCLDNSIKAH